MKTYFVYIMTNNSGTLYVGMTNDLRRRVSEYKAMLVEGFTKRYKITKLIYFEEFSDVRYAIERETRIKTWSRKKKLNLVATMNPRWEDLNTY
ncbi:MAG: GIY-YIG nuclease family protein [Ignavibacteriales bacterium]|nr:GIY-YIG nuclease family protein [Ignavibacteriales bacterium]